MSNKALLVEQKKLYLEIEDMRKKLNEGFEKATDTSQVLTLSQQLDNLISRYMAISNGRVVSFGKF